MDCREEGFVGRTAQHPDELSLSRKTGQRRTKHGKMQIVQKGEG